MKNILKKLLENILKREIDGNSSSSNAANVNYTNNFNFSLTSINKNKIDKEELKKTNSLSKSLPSPELTTTSNPSPFNDEKYYDEIDKNSNNRPSSVPVQHQSAFKPYNVNDRKLLPLQKGLFNPYIPTALTLFSHDINSFMMPADKFGLGTQINATPENLEQRNLIVQHAIDMETLVSNLGKSKQGHLCIYCGKIYSRKYGLKIHIR